MGLFGGRSTGAPPEPQPAPQDIEALQELVKNLETATDEAGTGPTGRSTSRRTS